MDLTSKYIEMCVKAEELQSEWKPAVGDYVFWDSKVEGPTVALVYNVDEKPAPVLLKAITLKDRIYHIVGMDDIRFIPREDQLQEMIPDGLAWKHVLFDEWIRKQEDNWLTGDVKEFESFEQLWLAFVMWMKYRKVWDNEQKEWKVFEDYRIIESDVKGE